MGSLQAINAQEYSIGGFASLPVGAYGSSDLEDGGFAKTGIGFSFESANRMDSWPEWLMVGFQFSYQINELDGRAVGEAFNSQPGTFTATVSSSFYRPLSITAGPIFRKRLSDKFYADLKLGGGMMISNIDPITIAIFDANQNLLVSEETQFESKPVFALLFGLNLGYDLTEKFGVRWTTNFATANEKINTTDVDSEQKIRSINTGLSLVIKF